MVCADIYTLDAYFLKTLTYDEKCTMRNVRPTSSVILGRFTIEAKPRIKSESRLQTSVLAMLLHIAHARAHGII